MFTVCLQCVISVSDLSVFQEVMINVGDVGKDYEHGVQLLKKLGEFRGTGDGVREHCGGLMIVLSAKFFKSSQTHMFALLTFFLECEKMSH